MFKIPNLFIQITTSQQYLYLCNVVIEKNALTFHIFQSERRKFSTQEYLRSNPSQFFILRILVSPSKIKIKMEF